MPIEAITETPDWDQDHLQATADRACGAVLARLDLDPEAWEVAVMGCDDARIAALNAEFRGKPAPTNVLSWPAQDLAPTRPGAWPPAPQPGPVPPDELGDIAVAFGVCAAEAAAQGKPFDDHLTHLLVHATLHLLGFDHETDEDAALMEPLETEILATLGVKNPY